MRRRERGREVQDVNFKKKEAKKTFFFGGGGGVGGAR